MVHPVTNILRPFESRPESEVLETFAATDHFLFERVVSCGHSTPAGMWMDQPRDEWVVLLSGAARLRFQTTDEVVELSFKTAPVHQGYIEPHATLARFDSDGQVELWVSSQGHFVVRTMVCRLLGIRTADLRVHAAEIGGAFGGKTVVYVEPVAVALSRKSGHPVKIMMSREEVFKATGPTKKPGMPWALLAWI